MKKSFAHFFVPVIFFAITGHLHAQTTTDRFMIRSLSEQEQHRFSSIEESKSRVGNAKRTMASDNFDVNFYRCEWQVDPMVRYIKGAVTTYFHTTASTSQIIVDLSDSLTVDSIRFHNQLIGFDRIAGDGLRLLFPVTLTQGIQDSVSIFYQGVPRVNVSPGSFTRTNHYNGSPIIWTLSEPFGAKEWWPCKNGLNDKADSIDIIIHNPSLYQASSNGVMILDTTEAGTRTTFWKHRYPIASYLVAMAVSDFVVQKDSIQLPGRNMKIIDYPYPEYAADFDVQRPYTKQALILFSKLFGEYPFAKEKYGFTQIGTSGQGGMEHQTNTFLTYPTISLIEHETGHQWFGDKITCGSWQDVWLNEGFATYSQLIFNEYIDTENYVPILSYFISTITSQPGGSVFVTDTTSQTRIFDGRLSYNKGCFLIRMLRWKLGDSTFFRGVRRYLQDPKLQYNYARTDDFIRNMQQESGQDLSSFFKKWLYGEGYANYSCTWRQNKNNWAYVTVNQTTSHPSVAFYDMPLQLEFKNTSRDTVITVNNTANGESFWINPGFAADTMLVDPFLQILAKDRISKKQLTGGSTNADDVSVYPNPSPDFIHISIKNPTAQKIDVQLYNIVGALVYQASKSLNGQDELINIPLVNLAKAAYVLKLSDKKNINLKKIIIKQ